MTCPVMAPTVTEEVDSSMGCMEDMFNIITLKLCL